MFKGALIIGLLAGIMGGGQGYAYTATYPDEASRAQFKTSLEAAPSLSIIYGEIDELPSPAGYMAYRTGMFLTVIASIWALMAVIKLLRGQEEDGRWEMIASGSITSKEASIQVFTGFMSALSLAFILSVAGMSAIGILPEVNAPATAGTYLSLAIFVPAALFASLGFFVSQLSITKRRALFYGLIPLLILLAFRTIGNTVSDLHWLKIYTPFGWTELSHPTVDPHMAWFIPVIVLFPFFTLFGRYLIGKRDLGAGIIPESSTAKPHYSLLNSPIQLAFRQNVVSFISWGIGILFLSALMATISGIAASAVADSESLKLAVAQLGGSDNIAIAFIGAGFVMVAMALLLMVTTGLGGVRKDEAKNQLDNILVQPVRRSSWLAGRLGLIAGTATLVSLVCAVATWAMAGTQNISLDLGTLLLVSIALMGTIVFTLGFGAFLYGILPRFAVIGMYLVIVWSFLI
ncbi:MAG TPA: hypothetical protein VGP12_05695, partial [Nitrosospira sp.]|nr:hypothetical protein [Nitrosospira sp.]